MGFRKWCFVLSVLLMAGSAVCGVAAEAPPDKAAAAKETVVPAADAAGKTAAEKKAGGEATVLSPIIVTATRSSESVFDIPQSCTIIDSGETESPMVKNMADIMRDYSDVRVDSFGSVGAQTTVSIRGLNSNQSLYLLDGRPINDINNGGFDFSKLPVENVERVEVVRGPGSSLYGSNALGGMVNIITKVPESKRPTFSSKSSYGMFGTFDQAFSHGLNLGMFGYQVSGNYLTSDGYRQNSDYRGYNVAGQSFFKPFELLRFDYSFLYHQDALGVPGAEPREGTVAPYGTSEVTSTVDRNRNRDFYSSVKATADLSEKLTAAGRFYYDFQKLRGFQRYAGLDPNTWANITIDNDTLFDTYTVGTDYQVDYELWAGNDLSSGVDVRTEQLRGWNAEYKLDNGDTVSNTSWKPHVRRYGIWLEDKWQVAKILRLQSAIRYDWHQYFHGSWNPSAGMVLDVTPDTQFKVSGGKAYRAPTFNDLFWPQGGNRALVPEKGWSGEWAVDQQFCKKKVNLHAGIVAWYMIDKIQWFPDTQTGNWTPQNMNSQRLVGLELAGTWKPTQRLKLYCGWNYYRSQQVTKEIQYDDGATRITDTVWRRAAFIPRHMVNFGTSYEFPWKMRVEANGTLRTDRVNYYTDWTNWPNVGMNTKKLGEIFTVDLLVSQDLLKYANVYLLMRNLFDAEGSEMFGSSYNDRDYPIMPFYMETGVKVSF
ncbi:MAG TPA: TonB-dependent receptor [bacterium]|nr:TonB-dependent receptor [bacterium]